MKLKSDQLNTILQSFSTQKVTIIRQILTYLSENNIVCGLFLGGSCTYKQVDSYSDIDLFSVIADGQLEEFQSQLKTYVNGLSDLFWAIYGQKYPWFGTLTSIYWRDPFLFSIDVGAVEIRDLPSFFVEPTALILLDCDGKIESRRHAVRLSLGAHHASKLRETLNDVLKSLLKIRKALHRQHLWSAFHYLGLLRRYLIFFIRVEHSLNIAQPLLGNPERDIEDYASPEILAMIAKTTADYSVLSLVRTTIAITKQIIALSCIKKHETITRLIEEILEIFESDFPITSSC